MSGSTVGIIGEYLTFTSTLVASPMRNGDLGEVHLFDVDGSTVPFNLRGLVTATGLRNQNFDTTAKEPEIVDLRHLTLPAALPLEDFTMHIEPDWQGDTQNCLLMHRHEGRQAYRVNVLDKLETLHHLFVEQGLSAQQKNLCRPASLSNSPGEVRFKVRSINLATFHGWQFPSRCTRAKRAAASTAPKKDFSSWRHLVRMLSRELSPWRIGTTSTSFSCSL